MAGSVFGILSMTVTSYPFFRRYLTSTLPMCPVPPVTIIITSLLYWEGVALARFHLVYKDYLVFFHKYLRYYEVCVIWILIVNLKVVLFLGSVFPSVGGAC